MKKITSYVFKLIVYPLKYGKERIRSFLYFYLPNSKRLLNKRIIFEKNIKFSQYTICKGEGLVYIGEKCSFGYKLGGFHRCGSVEIQARYHSSTIKIGNNVLMNNNIFICAANYIEIGDDTLIGNNVVIMDHEAHGNAPEKRRQLGEVGSVSIGKNVWIGNSVTVLKNSKVGNNSIIAAGALVKGNFPENVIIGGVHAKIIKKI